MLLPAGASEGIPASRMSELIQKDKDLGDSEKLFLTKGEPLLKAHHSKRENKVPGAQSSC